MTYIASDELEFHPHSFADPLGRVFVWKGGLYRAISPEWEQSLRSVLEHPVVARLMSQGVIVETEPTELVTDDYPLIVRQRQVPFVSYPHEWPVPMFRDACRLIIDLCIELRAAGYTLKDGHPWNVVFDFGRPVFVDVGSIVPLDTAAAWPAYDEFCRFSLFPLLMMAAGKERLARALLPTPDGVTRAELSMLSSRRASAAKWLWRVARRLLGQSSAADALSRLRAEIDSVRTSPIVPRPTTPPSHDIAAFMLDVLTAVDARSALVLADPALALAAARNKRQIVAFHLDSRDGGQLYERASAENLTILPLALDFTIPTPSTGIGGHWLIAASERLRCEALLGPGLVEDLVFKRHLRFEHIALGIAAFCHRVAVIDFPSAAAREGRPPWYTPEALAQALAKYFSSVRREHLRESSSTLIVCEDSKGCRRTI